MTDKLIEEEMELVIATGKMTELGLYEEEIAEILEQPLGKVCRWVWFHEMNKAIKSKAEDLSK